MGGVCKHCLTESMASRGEDIAIVWKGMNVSYRQMVDEVHTWSEELARLKVEAGDAVAICGDYSPSTCALMISLIANRNVVVPLTLARGARCDDLLKICQARTSFHFES